MAQAIRRAAGPHAHDVRATSRPVGPAAHHAQTTALTTATVVLGLVALALGAIPSMHLVGTAVGIAGVAVGLWSQLVSESTRDRWFDVVGLGAAAVGLWMSIMNGGLYGAF